MWNEIFFFNMLSTCVLSCWNAVIHTMKLIYYVGSMLHRNTAAFHYTQHLVFTSLIILHYWHLTPPQSTSRCDPCCPKMQSQLATAPKPHLQICLFITTIVVTDGDQWESKAKQGKGKLTHWGRDKMDAIFQMTLSNAFSWMKMYEFWLKFHWRLFLRV